MEILFLKELQDNEASILNENIEKVMLLSNRDIKNDIEFIKILIQKEKIEIIEKPLKINSNCYPNQYSKLNYETSLMRNIFEICFSYQASFKFSLTKFEYDILILLEQNNFFNRIYCLNYFIKFLYLGNLPLLQYLLNFIEKEKITWIYDNSIDKKLEVNISVNKREYSLEEFKSRILIEYQESEKMFFNDTVDIGFVLSLNQKIKTYILTWLSLDNTFVKKIENILLKNETKPFICSSWFPGRLNGIIFSDELSIDDLTYLIKKSGFNFSKKDNNNNNILFYLTTYWILDFSDKNSTEKDFMSKNGNFLDLLFDILDINSINCFGKSVFDIEELPIVIRNIFNRYKDKQKLLKEIPQAKLTKNIEI